MGERGEIEREKSKRVRLVFGGARDNNRGNDKEREKSLRNRTDQ